MKVVNTLKLIQAARTEGYAVPAINVDNTDTVMAVFELCQQLHSPVIFQLSPVQVYNRNTNYKTILNTITAIGADYDVTCSLHLDHGCDMEDLKIAVQSGFTSVMYDGSKLSFEENIENTRTIRSFTQNISLEAELGIVFGEEGQRESVQVVDDLYTNVTQADEFVKITNVDFLAVAIGNAHGVYKREPQINFKRLRELNEALNIPLVLHGASGLSAEDIRQAIMLGIAKINFFTDIDGAFTQGILRSLQENPDSYTFQYLVKAREIMKEKLKNIITMCGSEGKV